VTDKAVRQSADVRLYGANRATNGLIWYPIATNSSGYLFTVLTSQTGQQVEIGAAGDSIVNVPAGLRTIPYNELFNGSTWDRQRANTEETYLASAARTATLNSADFVNYNAKGLHVVINVTALAATPSIVPFIQGKDPVSGTYYDILEGLPITTTGINIIKVYPGISAIVDVSASDLLPRTYRLRIEHGDADSITYSVAGSLVL